MSFCDQFIRPGHLLMGIKSQDICLASLQLTQCGGLRLAQQTVFCLYLSHFHKYHDISRQRIGYHNILKKADRHTSTIKINNHFSNLTYNNLPEESSFRLTEACEPGDGTGLLSNR